MSENENQESTIAANLCKNGCGFYGSTQFDGMCSVCHKETLKKRQRQDDEQILQKPNCSPLAATMLSSSSSASNSYGPASNDDEHSPHQQPKGGSATDAVQQSQPPTVEPGAGSAPAPPAGAASASAVVPPSQTLHHMPDPERLLEAASVSSSVTESSGSTLDSSLSQSRKRIRCGTCKKKVGLTGFDCRCGGVYCSAHRYSDKHDCPFDYQSHGQEQIRKANPQVVSSKIDKL